MKLLSHAVIAFTLSSGAVCGTLTPPPPHPVDDAFNGHFVPEQNLQTSSTILGFALHECCWHSNK